MRFAIAAVLCLVMVDHCHAQLVMTHDYRLNGSFADDLGGPSIATGGGILGATSYTFANTPLGTSQGPSLSGALGNPGVYSISMWFSINDVNDGDDWHKLIDFANLSSEDGLYEHPLERLAYLPFAVGPAGVFSSNTLTNVVVTRAAGGTFTGFVNGVQSLSVANDFGLGVFSGPSNVIHFMRDDVASFPQNAGGFLDRVTIFLNPLTASEVTSVFNAGADGFIPVPEPSTYAMLAIVGVAGLFYRFRRRRVLVRAGMGGASSRHPTAT